MSDEDEPRGRLDQASELAYQRLVVSPAALLSIGTAARLVGGREARAWVETNVPIRWVAGQRRVLWQDVIDASARTSGLDEPAPPRTTTRRVRLADV